MFAVIRTGGTRYRVTPNAAPKVEKPEAVPGTTAAFTHVLSLGAGDGRGRQGQPAGDVGNSASSAGHCSIRS